MYKYDRGDRDDRDVTGTTRRDVEVTSRRRGENVSVSQ